MDKLSLCYLQPTFVQRKGNIIVDRVKKGDLGKSPSSLEKIYSESENTKQPDLVKEGANKLIEAVKEDYNQFLVCYAQGKDWEFSKRSVEARYEWLADTVKDDLCKKWNEHYSSYKQLLERAGGEKNPEIYHIAHIPQRC